MFFQGFANGWLSVVSAQVDRLWLVQGSQSHPLPWRLEKSGKLFLLALAAQVWGNILPTSAVSREGEGLSVFLSTRQWNTFPSFSSSGILFTVCSLEALPGAVTAARQMAKKIPAPRSRGSSSLCTALLMSPFSGGGQGLLTVATYGMLLFLIYQCLYFYL